MERRIKMKKRKRKMSQVVSLKLIEIFFLLSFSSYFSSLLFPLDSAYVRLSSALQRYSLPTVPLYDVTRGVRDKKVMDEQERETE